MLLGLPLFLILLKISHDFLPTGSADGHIQLWLSRLNKGCFPVLKHAGQRVIHFAYMFQRPWFVS